MPDKKPKKIPLLAILAAGVLVIYALRWYSQGNFYMGILFVFLAYVAYESLKPKDGTD